MQYKMKTTTYEAFNMHLIDAGFRFEYGCHFFVSPFGIYVLPFGEPITFLYFLEWCSVIYW